MEKPNQDPNRTPSAGEETAFKGSRIETDPVEPISAANGHPPNSSPEDDIPYEERALFAGVEADDDDELVTTDELIEPPSTARERGVENSPLSRLGFVAGALGAIVIVIWMLSGFFTGGGQQAQDTEEESPLPAESATTYGEDDRMRAELALIEQERAQPQQRLAETPQRPTPEAEEPAAEPTEPTSSPPTRVSQARPTPTPPRPAAAPPTRLSEPAASPATPSPPFQAEAVDPLEQWSRLSTAGASGAEVALVPEPEIPEPEGFGEQSAASMTLASDPQAISEPETRASSRQLPFPSDTVGDNPIPLPNEQTADTPTIRTVSQQRQNLGREFLVASSTPGARGIIQQHPVTSSDEVTGATENARRRQVAMGNSTAGKVIVPVVFAGGEVSARGRFAIEVSEPLIDIDGNVALEAGTVLITQLTEILDANILRQQVVAIVYRDAEGQVRQEAVEPGVLIIRGDDNQPLIAQVRNNESSSDLGQDLLVGTPIANRNRADLLVHLNVQAAPRSAGALCVR
ncbi:MAG: hypothetical protein AAGA01_05790, partial [Cyanobacteria bacterium P01_E01_bin.43]